MKLKIKKSVLKESLKRALKEMARPKDRLGEPSPSILGGEVSDVTREKILENVEKLLRVVQTIYFPDLKDRNIVQPAIFHQGDDPDFIKQRMTTTLGEQIWDKYKSDIEPYLTTEKNLKQYPWFKNLINCWNHNSNLFMDKQGNKSFMFDLIEAIHMLGGDPSSEKINRFVIRHFSR